MLSVGEYARFIGIGAFVGAITVACREVLAYLLAVDTRVTYSVSVAGAYAIGIALSYLLNRRITFSAAGAWRWKPFLLFIAIALLSLITTWLLSLALRYGLRLDSFIGSYAAAAAFAAAAFLSSLLAYPLNAIIVFGRRSAPAHARS